MRLIFVGGCERSGTSLVQKILASNSRIAGGAEFVFTGRIAELYRKMAASYPDPYATRIEAFYDDEKLEATFRSFYGSFFRRRFEQKPGAQFFAEKTPSNILAAKQLLKIFPDSFFVHVYRDGRAVLASHRDVRRRFVAAGETGYNRKTFEIRRICARWNRAVKVHRELQADEGLADRWIGVRFEDLVLDPKPVLVRLFRALEVDLEDKAFEPERITAADTGVPIDGFWYTEEMYRQGFEASRIERWRNTLPASIRAWGSLLMAENLNRLDYPVGNSYLLVHRALRALLRTSRAESG